MSDPEESLAKVFAREGINPTGEVWALVSIAQSLIQLNEILAEANHIANFHKM